MKKYFKFFVAAALVGFLAVGCAKDEETVQPDLPKCELNHTFSITITNALDERYDVYQNGIYIGYLNANEVDVSDYASGSHTFSFKEHDWILWQDVESITVKGSDCEELVILLK